MIHFPTEHYIQFTTENSIQFTTEHPIQFETECSFQLETDCGNLLETGNSKLIILDRMFVAYVVVFMPTVVVNILYAVATIVGGDVEGVNKMPSGHSIVMRLTIEYQTVGDVVHIEETSANGLVAWLDEFAVQMDHSDTKMPVHGEYEFWQCL